MEIEQSESSGLSRSFTIWNPRVTAPVNLPKGSAKVIKAKAFYQGKESLTTYLWM